jgi:hypothetical protein
MSLLKSRQHRGRFAPKVEALEDRSLLSAIVTGEGQIVTTGSNNHLVITDNGQFVAVFAENRFLASFAEGTPITVSTNAHGSTNLVNYDLLGSNNTAGVAGPSLLSSLTVNFGCGFGALNVAVLSSLSAGSNPSVSDLGASSSVQVTSTTTSPPPGATPLSTQTSLEVGSVGALANLVMVAESGSGVANSFNANLSGTQGPLSLVSLVYLGKSGGALNAQVTDSQNIARGAETLLTLQGGPFSVENVDYTGQLRGLLKVTEFGGFRLARGTGGGILVVGGDDHLELNYNLLSGSTGQLISSQTGGFNDTDLHHVIHKPAGDNPSVQASTFGNFGFSEAFLTTGNLPTNVFVQAIDVTEVIPVN